MESFREGANRFVKGVKMFIQDKIGNVTIKVGEVKNHVTLSLDNDYNIIEIHYANWIMIKAQVDKMFQFVDKMERG